MFQRFNLLSEYPNHRWSAEAASRGIAYSPPRLTTKAGRLLEAALGETESAIARLRPLTSSSDDPDYAAQLARILGEAGWVEEARHWRARAAARYDELVARHLEAFAYHAAEFWLEAGADPQRALWLAMKNIEVRPTRRARDLLARARRSADGDTAPETTTNCT